MDQHFNDSLGLERLLFFSDAVMAIAITLLAIDLKIPEIPAALAIQELPRQLDALTPRIISFVISFVVIGIYWSSHHRYFGYIRRYDGRLVALNMLFLMFIVLMPFVASLFGQHHFLPIGVIAYAAEVAAIGLMLAALWWYATRQHRLVDQDLDEIFIHNRMIIALASPLPFLLSIPLALISEVAALTVWWLAPFLALGALRLIERKGSGNRVESWTARLAQRLGRNPQSRA